LERAAATIEQLEDQARRASERLASAESDAGRGRENEQILQRTLMLAQKTADEAVSEAQARAKQMVEEAEARAYSLVSEAEATARRMAMAEQRRLEAEVLGLGARREALLSDIDNLERFESEYRTRLRRAIEADLASLDARQTVTTGPRPQLHEVDLPAAPPDESVGAPSTIAAPPPPPPPTSAPAPPTPAAAPVATETPERPAGGVVDREPGDNQREPEPSASSAAASTDSPPPPPPPPPPPSSVPPPPAADERRDDARPREQLFPEDPHEPAETEVLDDDAFFASLREAVRDDRPLGPSEHEEFDDEDDDTGRFGNVFKRRR
ncbi:MAG: DivIVA domain-containing protein, partial [Actinobacteria bacterium]|nr:DivIVA domain-containing protein [Actinomycetota bacterium]